MIICHLYGSERRAIVTSYQPDGDVYITLKFMVDPERTGYERLVFSSNEQRNQYLRDMDHGNCRFIRVAEFQE